MWRRREAPPPSWMVVWALGRQQTQQKHMQMYAKHEHAYTLYGRRLHPTKIMDLRNLQGVQTSLCEAGNIQCISYCQPLAAINIPKYFLPLVASTLECECFSKYRPKCNKHTHTLEKQRLCSVGCPGEGAQIAGMYQERNGIVFKRNLWREWSFRTGTALDSGTERFFIGKERNRTV